MINDWTKVQEDFYKRDMNEFHLHVVRRFHSKQWEAIANGIRVGLYSNHESAMHGAEKYAALSSKS